MAKGYTLSESAVKRTAETVRRVLGDPIPAVKKGKGKSVITASQVIWLKIVGFTAIATNRWEYSGYKQVPDPATGVGQFVDAEDTPVLVTKIYNTCETNNTATGIQGNSVDTTTLPAGFSIQPIKGNPVLTARLATLDGGVATYLVTYQNAVDGECA